MKKIINKTIRFLISLLLWIIAVVLIIPLTILNFCFVWRAKGTAKGYFLSTAVSLDSWGNREFRTLWNSTLLKPTSKHHFGDIRETISSVLGKNQQKNTLSKAGSLLAKILDFLDKNHCQKSIVYY